MNTFLLRNFEPNSFASKPTHHKSSSPTHALRCDTLTHTNAYPARDWAVPGEGGGGWVWAARRPFGGPAPRCLCGLIHPPPPPTPSQPDLMLDVGSVLGPGVGWCTDLGIMNHETSRKWTSGKKGGNGGPRTGNGTSASDRRGPDRRVGGHNHGTPEVQIGVRRSGLSPTSDPCDPRLMRGDHPLTPPLQRTTGWKYSAVFVSAHPHTPMACAAPSLQDAGEANAGLTITPDILRPAEG